MINEAREIRPEDFAYDYNRVWSVDADGDKRKRKYENELKEMERLYHIQEETKARVKYKAEQERKDAIPYSESIITEICGRISDGEFLINICKDPNMPTVRRINEWLKEHTDFKGLHDVAVNDRLNRFEDEIITIPDEAAKDTEEIKTKGVVRRVLDPTKITAAKLRADCRRATLKAYRPERWGDQSVLTVNNNDSISDLTDDELAKKLEELEDKENIIKVA